MDPIPVSPPSPAVALAKEGTPPPSPGIIPPDGTKEGPIPHPSKHLWLLVGLGILATGIVVGFLGTKGFNPSTSQSTLIPTPSPKVTSSFTQLVASPTPSPNPTSNWKTYISNKFNFEVKYPSSWKYLEVPTPDYQTQNHEVWLTHSDFPRPQTGARSDLVLVITSSDPSTNWLPQYFNNYESINY